MASSDEETTQPMGFSLKIPKFTRSMNRYGRKNSRFSLSSQKDGCSSVHHTSPIDDLSYDSSASEDATTNRACHSDDKPPPKTRGNKRRSQKQVLASLSANAKRMKIPIPSFQMMKKRRKSELSRLERVFFDDDDEDDENNKNADATICNSHGKDSSHAVGPKVNNTNRKGAPAANSHPCGKIKKDNAAASSALPEQPSSVRPREDNSIKPSKSGDHSTDETESEDSDFERECSSPSNQEACEQQPKPQPPNVPEEHEAKTKAVCEDKVVEADEAAKDCNHSSLPSGVGFEEKPLEINNNNQTENDYEDEEVDSNFVDFGGCDSGGDVEDITEGNCQELPNVHGSEEQTVEINSATTATGASVMEPDVTCHNESISPLFDLEHQIDLLFLKTDTNTITMKMFCKALEGRIGVSLEKATKKRVKARVLSLLKGEIIPSPDLGQTVCTGMYQDGTNNRGAKSPAAHSISPENTISEKSDNEDNESTKRKNSIEDSNEHNEPREIKNSASEVHSIVESACEGEVVDENRVTSISNINEDGKETTMSYQEPIARKKKGEQECQQNEAGEIYKNSTAKKTSNSWCVEIEIGKEKLANPELDNQAESKPVTSRKKRQRSKPKLSDGGAKSTGSEETAVPEKKTNRTRKRPRKAAACALCKTCPCQKAHSGNDSENMATLDMKKFSRSDEAIARTLSRRLLKLEKSTEHLEEQTEKVRRMLKKHNRDVWKREERKRGDANGSNSTGGRTTDSYFLPDAEIFERQQSESQGLPGRVVEKAQTKVFQEIPTYQPTLFEMMGIPRDSDKTKQNTDSDVVGTNEDQCDNNANIVDKTGFSHDIEQNDESDDDIPTEYIPERTCAEKIHRLEWKNDARESPDTDTGIASGSIFDTVLQMTQDNHDEVDDGKRKATNSLPLWDDLFESKDRGNKKARTDTEAGLDALLYLFEDGTTDSNREDGLSLVQTGKDEDRINISLLSQGAQNVANEMISNISSREKTAATLEGSCPNWKENIYFALMQKDPDELQEALENVKQSRMRMHAQKEELLKAWERKNTALEVFETALKTSFDRLNSNSSSISR